MHPVDFDGLEVVLLPAAYLLKFLWISLPYFFFFNLFWNELACIELTPTVHSVNLSYVRECPHLLHRMLFGNRGVTNNVPVVIPVTQSMVE